MFYDVRLSSQRTRLPIKLASANASHAPGTGARVDADEIIIMYLATYSRLPPVMRAPRGVNRSFDYTSLVYLTFNKILSHKTTYIIVFYGNCKINNDYNKISSMMFYLTISLHT